MGISADRVENVLWRDIWDICLQHTTKFVVLHSGTNNVDQSQPEDIAVGVMKIAEIFVKNNPCHHYWHVTEGQDVLFSVGKN